MHSSTGFPPAEVLLGMKTRLPVDLLSSERIWMSYGEFARGHLEKLGEVCDRVGWNITEFGKKTKKIFDRRSYLEGLRIGDRVWLRNLSRTKWLSPKIQTHWDGPFEILAVKNYQS